MRDWQLDGTPQHVTGTIVDLSWNGTGRGGGCRVVFEYVTGDGVEKRGIASVLPNTFFQMHVGDKVPVMYFLQNPGHAWIDLPSVTGERKWWFDDAGFLGMGVFCVILGLFSIQLSWPQNEKSWEDAAVRMDTEK